MIKTALAAIVLLFATVCVAHGDVEGLVVNSVNEGGAAAAAGVQVGDRIMRIDGQEAGILDALKSVMAAHQAGDRVSLVVERAGETVDLTLTLGQLAGGGASLGVSIAVGAGAEAKIDSAEAEAGTAECLGWIDKTYRIESMIENLNLDLPGAYETMRTCVGRDTRRMSRANAVKYCDNVFKVHCSGLDLLNEIGEAQVGQCEDRLNETLGLKMEQYRGWKTCAQREVFDRYSLAGEASNDHACKSAFLGKCGTNIDAATRAGSLSADQKGFVDCCSADALDSASLSDSGSCRMIDNGFSRGPCHDQSVCVDRFTNEWIQCSVPG